MGSLKKGVKKLAIGKAAADDGPKLWLVNCHSCKTEKISNSVGSPSDFQLEPPCNSIKSAHFPEKNNLNC